MDEKPDLAKLRRFALAIGFILFTYSIAGVDIDPNETTRPLGIPLKIRQPGLIGVGLLITSLYSAVRYWYYGLRAISSPLAERRMLRGGVIPASLAQQAAQTLRDHLGWNQLSFPVEFRDASRVNDLRAAVLQCSSKLNNDVATTTGRLFPGLPCLEFQGGQDPLPGLGLYDLQHEQYVDDQLKNPLERPLPSLTLRLRGVGLPPRRHPMLVWHSLDYTLPLWVNGIAIAAYLLPWRLVLSYITR